MAALNAPQPRGRPAPRGRNFLGVRRAPSPKRRRGAREGEGGKRDGEEEDRELLPGNNTGLLLLLRLRQRERERKTRVVLLSWELETDASRVRISDRCGTYAPSLSRVRHALASYYKMYATAADARARARVGYGYRCRWIDVRTCRCVLHARPVTRLRLPSPPLPPAPSITADPLVLCSFSLFFLASPFLPNSRRAVIVIEMYACACMRACVRICMCVRSCARNVYEAWPLLSLSSPLLLPGSFWPRAALFPVAVAFPSSSIPPALVREGPRGPEGGPGEGGEGEGGKIGNRDKLGKLRITGGHGQTNRVSRSRQVDPVRSGAAD